MNIADVLVPGSLGETKSNSALGKEGAVMSTDSLLFALFLQNFSGLQTEATGQFFEESAQEDSAPGSDTDLAGSILGQNFYLPIFQNLFPAGKEANPGSNGEQTLISFSLSNPIFNGSQEGMYRALLGEMLGKDSIGTLSTIGAMEVTDGTQAGDAVGATEDVQGIGAAEVAEVAPVVAAAKPDEVLPVVGLAKAAYATEVIPINPSAESTIVAQGKAVTKDGESTIKMSLAEVSKAVQGDTQATRPLNQNSLLNAQEVTMYQQTSGNGQQGNYGQAAAAIQAIGREGISGPAVKSLDPVELEKYRITAAQLEELSGKIELVKNQVENGENSSKLPQYTIAQSVEENQIGENKQTINLVKDLDTAMVQEQESLSSMTAPVEGEVGQDSSSGSKGEEKGSANSQSGKELNTVQPSENDHYQAQFIAPKTDDIRGMEKTPVNKELGNFDSVKVWDQVLNILKKQDLRSNDIKELTLQLQPAELGKVNVSLRLENGLIHLTMNASEQATSSMLQNNLQDLRNGLAQMGVSCGSLEMGSSQDQQYGSGRENYPNAQASSGNSLLEEEKVPSPALSWYAQVNGAGSRINVSV